MSHYSTLGIPDDSDPGAIKKAYRKLALALHPDRTGGSDVEFKKISEAYSVLSDPQQKRMYDVQHRCSTNPLLDIFSNFPEVGMLAVFSGILSDHLNMAQNCAQTRVPDPPARKRQVPTRQPVTHTIHLSLEECYAGKACKFAVSRKTTCASCRGEGGFDKTAKACIGCAGTGVRVTHRNAASVRQTRCMKCRGGKTRMVYARQCGVCKGQSVTKERAILSTEFAPGVTHGSTNMILGEGNLLGGGDNDYRGDVVAKVSQRKHHVFSRKGDVLSCAVQITLRQSLLGFRQDICHLDGRTVTLSSCGITRPGDIISVENEGIPRGSGKLEARIDVIFPQSLTQEQRQALAGSL